MERLRFSRPKRMGQKFCSSFGTIDLLRVWGLQFPEHTQWVLGQVRNLAHAWWVRSVRRSWWRFWHENQPAVRETEPLYWRRIGQAGARAVVHASQSTFWEWSNGSGLFFWRWPLEYQQDGAER